jgi:adenylosuccinate synthase
MAHKVDLIIDLQYGSTGKGLIAGYLAKRENYDTAVCSFATNAGHTYIDKGSGIHLMTQQLPTSIVSATVKTILLGPGALIHWDTLWAELDRYSHLMCGKRLLIHPHAAIVENYHAESEIRDMLRIGSTAKGVGAAAIERIKRDRYNSNVALFRHPEWAHDFVVTTDEYCDALIAAENIIVEGAQGFGLSMYHGAYPYTTSRDVTPWQILADCGLPFKLASTVQIIGTLRTYPIRVNNRDGSSGPCYPDQREIQWKDIGVEPELTTVTKLPRRIFTFSKQQLDDALWHCGGYWNTRLFLNFANYAKGTELSDLIDAIQTPTLRNGNPSKVTWIGCGPDDVDVVEWSKK